MTLRKVSWGVLGLLSGHSGAGRLGLGHVKTGSEQEGLGHRWHNLLEGSRLDLGRV